MINTNNARTRKTMRNALGMTLGCLDEHKPRPLGTRFIDRYFSSQRHTTGKWLRQQLLIEHSGWNWEQKICKTYTYNPEGVATIRRLLDIPEVVDINQDNRRLAVEWVRQEHDINQVEYTDKSNRLWHPLQSLPRLVRNEYLSGEGLRYQYDIRSAAPTLLHQKSWEYSHGHILETIDDYIENRHARRLQLSEETDLPVDNIKRLINSLFAGARLSANPQSTSWDLCNQDLAVIQYLQQNPYISALRDDIRQMWEYLRPELPVYQVTSESGRIRNLQMTSRNKWSLYFQLERSVLNEIKKYLDHHGVRYLLIHDAFISDSLPDDIHVLECLVRESTGFDIRLDVELLSSRESE